MMSDPVIDVHIHIGTKNDPASGCYWSEDFEKGVAFFAFKLITNSLFREIDVKYAEKYLLRVINKSKRVDKCVLLALDQVYNEQGKVFDKNGIGKRTHLHVPNSYLANFAKAHDRVLFGASVHPYRSDWESELQYCIDNGAVLCKWIPSSQQIDLTHAKCEQFYEKLAANNLPLLCHVGPEGSIPPFDKTSQELNNPKHLKNALKAGVTVIAAHAALPLLPPPLDSEEHYRELVALFKPPNPTSWKLYAELSAINLGTRSSYVPNIKNDIPQTQLMFGSDYPIPLLDISQDPHISLGHWLKHFFQTVSIKNPLDKNFSLIENMNFDPSIFTNALKVLKLV
jgi:predicted TIM-barrel fold metal-dependent hydrolase